MNYRYKVLGIKIFLPVLLFAGVSCSDTEKVLIDVESIVELQPDSAFHLLNSILFPEDLSERMFHKHTLLLLMAKDKSYRDITGDTVIFAAKDYFARKKIFNDAAAAAFYAGRVLHEQDKAEKAIAAYLDAEQFAEQTVDYNLQGLIQGNLSMLYRKHLSPDESIIRGKRAIEMYKKAQNHKNEISSLILIGNCFLLKKDIDSAFRYYNKSINLADNHKISELQASARQNIGVAFREIKKYANAKKYLNEALTFKIDSVETARIFMNLSKVYSDENKLDSAKFYINKSLKLNIREVALSGSIYFTLSKIEEEEGNYNAALQYFKNYNEYVAQVVKENKSKALLEVNEKYDFEKLKNENIKLVINKQQTIIILCITIILASFSIFILCIEWIKSKKLVLELTQKIETLKKMAADYQSKDEKMAADYRSKNEKMATDYRSKNEKMAADYRSKDEKIRNIILKQYDIMKKVALLETNSNYAKADSKYMLKKFNFIVYGNEDVDFDSLYKVMNLARDGFYEKIHDQYANLITDQEFRVCCFSCEDFSDNEISIILKMTVNMVRKRRTEIRKKLKITDSGNIHNFLVEHLQK
jgi:tetratricopeptide (TPR) repeat protein